MEPKSSLQFLRQDNDAIIQHASDISKEPECTHEELARVVCNEDDEQKATQ